MEEKPIKRTLKSGLMVFLFWLIGCQGLQTTAVLKNHRVLVQGGPHHGTWQSKDVFIEIFLISDFYSLNSTADLGVLLGQRDFFRIFLNTGFFVSGASIFWTRDATTPPSICLNPLT